MIRPRTRSAALLLLAIILASCAHRSPELRAERAWTEPGLDATAPSATVAWQELPGVIAAIDGREVGRAYEGARLAPGPHALQYAYYTAGFGAHPSGTAVVELAADHAYAFRIALCFWCKPRRHAAWVEDRSTDQVVWGQRPDWPSWYL